LQWVWAKARGARRGTCSWRAGVDCDRRRHRGTATRAGVIEERCDGVKQHLPEGRRDRRQHRPPGAAARALVRGCRCVEDRNRARFDLHTRIGTGVGVPQISQSRVARATMAMPTPPTAPSSDPVASRAAAEPTTEAAERTPRRAAGRRQVRALGELRAPVGWRGAFGLSGLHPTTSD